MKSTTDTLLWTSIILSIIAITMSIVVFTRQSQIPEEIARQLELQERFVDQRDAVNQAIKNLEEIRVRLGAGTLQRDVALEQVEVIRSQLSRVFQKGSETSQIAWKVIDDELAQIGRYIKEGAVTLLDALDTVINNLKMQVK